MSSCSSVLLSTVFSDHVPQPIVFFQAFLCLTLLQLISFTVLWM